MTVGDRFVVLHVCTGNIGRSPMAERLMRLRLAELLGDGAGRFVVGSAGTWGHTGSPMEPFAEAALLERGADPSGFVARELEPDLVREADLVLGATTDHRSQAVTLEPSAVRRTFTLLEFARLASLVDGSDRAGLAGVADPVERAATAVALAASRRGVARTSGADDVLDPYGAPLGCYRERAAEIDAAVHEAVSLLAAGSH